MLEQKIICGDAIENLAKIESESIDLIISDLDPFLGSGTTLRVCQQLDRNGIGIEINPDYVKMSENRLNTPFNGFDSIDISCG